MLYNVCKDVRYMKGNSLIKNLNDYTVLDIETTGFSPKNNEIIELAAIKVRNGKIVDTYNSLIKPANEISSSISNLTGITNEMIKYSPNIEEEFINFLKFIGADIVIGHNITFDISFISTNSLKIFSSPFLNNYIDTLTLSRRYVKSPHHNLKTMANIFNIDYTGAHRALKDCFITQTLYEILKKEIH